MRTRKKLALGCGIASVAALIAAIVLVIIVGGAGIFVFGFPYSDTPRQRAWLQGICDPVKDVPLVIEAHFAKHGVYPKTIDELDRSLPGANDAIEGLRSNRFVYSSNGGHYSIYKKLNWDGGVHYDHYVARWEYGINDDTEWPIY